MDRILVQRVKARWHTRVTLRTRNEAGGAYAFATRNDEEAAP
jgi:hypothetical protein